MRASASINIVRPVTDVFAYVSTVENMPEWTDSVGDIRPATGDGPGVGDRYESTYTHLGNTYDVHFEVTEYEPPHRFAVATTEGPFEFEGRFELEECERGTLLSYSVDIRPEGRSMAFAFAAFKGFVWWVLVRQVRDELEELKSLLERDSPVEAGAPSVGASGA